jgi:hypothetical protein
MAYPMDNILGVIPVDFNLVEEAFLYNATDYTLRDLPLVFAFPKMVRLLEAQPSSLNLPS